MSAAGVRRAALVAVVVVAAVVFAVAGVRGLLAIAGMHAKMTTSGQPEVVAVPAPPVK